MTIRSDSTGAAEVAFGATKTVSSWADAPYTQQCGTFEHDHNEFTAFETTCPADAAKGFVYSASSLDPAATERALRVEEEGVACPPWWLPLFMGDHDPIHSGSQVAHGDVNCTYKICVVVESGFIMLRDNATSPEAVRSDTELKGFDVEIRALALREFDYTVRVLPTYGELQVRTRSGECDVGWAQFFQFSSRMSCAPNDETCRDLGGATVAGTSVQSWEPYRCCTRYGPNIFPFEIVAMSIADTDGGSDFFLSFVSMMHSAFFVNFICFIFLIGCVFSLLVWYWERKRNSNEFPPAFLEGMDDACWWAAVTFSTVGYGDKAPKTPMGRGLAVIWMILGVTLCSILTGHMATTFSERKAAATKATITSVEDLAGRRVCGYHATFASSWWLPSGVARESITPVVRENVAACGLLMQAGEVDVILMEKPMMDYWKRTDPWAVTADLVLGPPFATVPIGVIYSAADKTRSDVSPPPPPPPPSSPPSGCPAASSISAGASALPSVASASAAPLLPPLEEEAAAPCSSSDIATHLDVELFKLYESHNVHDMQSRWFGAKAGRSDDTGDQINWMLLGPTLGMVGLYVVLQVWKCHHSGENPCAVENREKIVQAVSAAALAAANDISQRKSGSSRRSKARKSKGESEASAPASLHQL